MYMNKHTGPPAHTHKKKKSKNRDEKESRRKFIGSLWSCKQVIPQP